MFRSQVSIAPSQNQTFIFTQDNIKMIAQMIPASSKRFVYPLSLFETNDERAWEEAYDQTIDKKYKKNTRKFNKKITGKRIVNGVPPIFLIPRERAGPSYKSNVLKGVNSEDVQYCPISKGYSMQDVSSFTLGPIVGEGLCLVNAAFSKSICIMHIEGGGKVDLKRKNFWRSSKKPQRIIEVVTEDMMKVDGKEVNIIQWLEQNEHLWFDEWDMWRKHIALCSMGDFHWTDASPVICYHHNKKYLNFVEWKKECYIKPSYELLPSTDVFQFIKNALEIEKVSIGLVHPKAITGQVEEPITKEYIKELFDSEYEMCCQPYVIAGKLLDVEI